uniref:SFRICE_033099 n=1 Tax=Spodoptera frugiperda TaxID=7108 RepID=A0A2H1W6B0_SPOFR
MLGGSNDVVEIDETHLYTRKGHSAVNHSLNFVGGTVDIPVEASLGVPAPGGNVKVKILTNTLERQWLELKRHCRTCRSQHRLNWYMGEYMYRHNILKDLPSDASRFRRLLRNMHRVYPGLGKRGIKIRNCRCRDPNCCRSIKTSLAGG